MPDAPSLTTDHYPPVTALCPTYGRFERLRDAVACFLLQDYPGEKRLLILNDAPNSIDCSTAGIDVVNVRSRYPTLGHKRQALLVAARTPLVAHWDDDDLYLPWHFAQCVEKLRQNSEAACVKSHAAWWGVGPPGSFELRGVRHNVFEGQMVFERQAALDLGGYPPLVSGQAKALLDRFRRAGKLYTWEPARDDISYIYRWGDGLCHISGTGNGETAHARFGCVNHDFGDDQPPSGCGSMMNGEI